MRVRLSERCRCVAQHTSQLENKVINKVTVFHADACSGLFWVKGQAVMVL
jgi:hypothetical protein